MSHIPSSKMPHAKPNDDEHGEHGNPVEANTHADGPDHAAQDTGQDAGGLQDKVREQAGKLSDAATAAAGSVGETVTSAAGSVGETVKSAATAVSEQAGSAAQAASAAAKTATDKVNGLPTYAKLIGAAALVGGIAAVAFLPILQQPEETGRGKRKKGKGDRKA